MADKRISELEKIDQIDHSEDELVIVDKSTNTTKKATADQLDHTQIQNVGSNSHDDIDAHINDDSIHAELDDSAPAADKVYSSQKTEDLLGDKADASHTHDASEVISGEFDDARISESSVTQHEQAIDHDELANYEADEHVDHSGVDITGQEGISGGGDITASRVLKLSLDSLQALADAANEDFLVVYDVSENVHRKITKENLLDGLAAGGGTKVKVTAADTTAGFLFDKLENTDGKLDFSVDDAGNDETLIINVVDGSIDHNALDNFDPAEHIKWGEAGAEQIDDSRVSESSVTQHQGAIDHDQLAGFVLNEHINHETIDIATEEGIQGGGDITQSRTLKLDVDGLDVDPTPDNNNDFLLGFDVSEQKHKKILINDITVLTSGGEVNTGQNIGDRDAGVFKDKSGSSLRFRGLDSEHTRFLITENADDIDFTLDLNDRNILKVETTPKTDEYGSIEDAIIAINNFGDASPSNQYIIKVGTGLFSENELTLPTGVRLIGSTATTVIPAGDHTVINMESISHIENITFSQISDTRDVIVATDAGTITGTNCLIVGGKCGLRQEATIAGPDNIGFFKEMVFLNQAESSIQLKSTSSSAVVRQRQLTASVIYNGTVTPSEAGMLIEGPKSTLIIKNCSGEKITNPGTGAAILLKDGGTLESTSSRLQNWEKGIVIPLGELNCNAEITSILFDDNDIDIEVLEPTASGFYDGYVPYLKANILRESEFFIVGKDPNIVTVAKKGGDFETINDALASITDESITNPYVIQVGPGDFDEAPFTLRSYITLAGTIGGLSVIKPTVDNQNFITLESSTQIVELEMYGPRDAGFYTLDVSGVSGLVLVRNSSFSNASGFLNISAGVGETPFVVLETTLTNSNVVDLRKAISIDANAASLVQVILSSSDFAPPMPNPNFEKYVEVTGPAQVQLRNVRLGQSAFAAPIGTGVELSDGAILQLESFSMDNMVYGIRTINAGAGPSIKGECRASNMSLFDISIENPDTVGALFATVDNQKVFIDPAATDFAYTSLDSKGAGLLVVSDIFQGDRKDRAINFSKLTRDSATLGLVTGGDLTITPPKTLNIAAGTGFLKDSSEDFIKQIDWEASSIVLLDDEVSYIYYNDNGILTKNASLPPLDTIILLGRVHVNDGIAEILDKSNAFATQQGNRTEEYLRQAIGAIYESGSIVTENGSRSLDVSVGSYFFGNKNFTPSGGSLINFREHYRDGVGGYIVSDQTVVKNNLYDDGSGTLVPVTTDYYVKHGLYIVGDGAEERYLLVLGQEEIENVSVAEQADIPLPPSNFTDSITLIASIITQEGESNFYQIRDERPVIGFKASGVSASTDHGNLLNLDVPDHHDWALVRDGSKPMVGNLNMGGNNVNNVGTVDGVDVSNHKDRHSPNGADPLDTAPAVTLDGDSTNTEGNANSFARSNHTHEILEATQTVSGLMSSADKTKMDGIEENAKDDQNAFEVPYNNADSSLTDTDVKAALDTVSDRTDTLDSDKLARDGSQPMLGNLNMNNNDIVTGSGTVDGRDVSADGATLDDHLNGTASRHDATEIDYERSDAAKTDIGGGSDDAETALSDLDDNKLSRNGNNTMAADLDMGGNAIVNVGNVDGRDVSADGAKLDTIETNAKDDQLASEVPFNPATSSLTSSNVQAMGEEVAGRLDSAESRLTANEGDIDDLESDVTDLQTDKLNRDGTQAMTGDLNMGGNNINNAGTIEGRDVAVDGTKLDTIETNAKDDQNADEVPFNNAGTTYSSNEVDGVLREIDARTADIDTDKLDRDGSQEMLGDLNMGGNNISNVGTVDGVDVSNHAARHAPNGADPLATGTPVTLGANSTNTEGNANSFARSNHTHDIATGVAVGVSNANTEGTSNNLARADHTHDLFADNPFEHDEDSSEGVSQTTSTTFQTKLTLTTASLTAGRKYRIGAFMEHVAGDNASSSEVRLLVNGVEVALQSNEREDTDDWFNFSPFFYFTPVSNGSIDIVLQYRRENSFSTISVRRARIEIERKA